MSANARRLVKEAQSHIQDAKRYLAWQFYVLVWGLRRVLWFTFTGQGRTALPQIRDTPREMKSIVGRHDLLVRVYVGAVFAEISVFGLAPSYRGNGWLVYMPPVGEDVITIAPEMRVRWIILIDCSTWVDGVRARTVWTMWAVIDMDYIWHAAYAPLRRRQCLRRLQRRADSLFSLLPRDIVHEIAEFIE